MNVSDLFNLYILFLPIGAGIAGAYVALNVFAGYIFGRNDLIVRAKDEIVQALVTLLLVPSLFFFLIPVFNEFVRFLDPIAYYSFCNNPTQEICTFSVSQSIMLEWIRESIWLYLLSVKANVFLGLINGLTVEGTFNAIVGFGKNVLSFVTSPQVVENKLVFEWVSNNLKIVMFIYSFLVAMENLFAPLLFVGLVLRLFPIVRKLGGLLLSIAFVVAFVMPLPIIFGGYVYHNIPPVSVGKDVNGNDIYMRIAKVNFYFSLTQQSGLAYSFDSINSMFNTISVVDPSLALRVVESSKNKVENYKQQRASFFQYASDLFRRTVNDFVDRLRGILRIIQSFFTSFVPFMIFPFVNFLHMLAFDSYLYKYIAQAAFSFITLSLISLYVAVITAIAFVKQLSPMLGGDVEIAGLTHLV